MTDTGSCAMWCAMTGHGRWDHVIVRAVALAAQLAAVQFFGVGPLGTTSVLQAAVPHHGGMQQAGVGQQAATAP